MGKKFQKWPTQIDIPFIRLSSINLSVYLFPDFLVEYFSFQLA